MEAKTQSDLRLPEPKKERSIIEKSAESCLICSTPTQKLHLQVNACYACAAFYRRSLEAHKTYKCQNNNEKCDLSVKQIGRPLCRLCRYNKCVEIGMVINAYKKDESSNNSKNDDKDKAIDVIKKDKEKDKEKINADDILLSQIMDLPSISEEGVLINMEYIFKQLKEIFTVSLICNNI
uniref:Nuclear receptor domain-containing protein n=1 Tax=Panagrolaimus sp. ES5 TaxID=591445 RepID=A0AC34FYU8_9BILA